MNIVGTLNLARDTYAIDTDIKNLQLNASGAQTIDHVLLTQRESLQKEAQRLISEYISAEAAGYKLGTNGINENSYFNSINAQAFMDKNKSFSGDVKSDLWAVSDKKYKNLNDDGVLKALKSAYGDVKLFLDFYDDGTNTLELNGASALFGLDSNKDGMLSSEDELFYKIKVKGYDEDGNEKISRLSDLLSGIDLTKFIKDEIINYAQKETDEYNAKIDALPKNNAEKYLLKKKNIEYLDYRQTRNASNPYTLVKAEYRYERLQNDEVQNFFQKYVGADGWVDLRDNKVFNKTSSLINFAYLKKSIDGSARLAEFNPIVKTHEGLSEDFFYTKYQKQNFKKLYEDYMVASSEHYERVDELIKNLKVSGAPDADALIAKLRTTKSSRMVSIENEFKAATGMDFSQKNLQRVKFGFENDEKATAYALKDTDAVVAMKLSKSGFITLRFDSGREIVVNELYSDTGSLNSLSKDKRISPNQEIQTMSEEQINSLDFGKIAVKTDEAQNEFKSLKELGAKLVSRLTDNKYAIYLSNGNIMVAKEFYNITYIDKFLNGDENFKADRKDRFYPKVDKLA
ncbi:response regulator [Campylobacter sp.]|uniref:response regulator n=1 Tax=Campylobacter sp. TaxID=205 RepID=UPI00290D3799|nr:response regulator [Campylobacter sp.]MDU6827877.1 response regulator [Campylobacter sp.]